MADQPGQAAQTSSTSLSEEDLVWLEYQDTDDSEGSKVATAVLNNPLVPLGMAATVAALGCGLVNMVRQNSKKQQFYMRARVGAQGFTIMSVVAGMFYHARGK